MNERLFTIIYGLSGRSDFLDHLIRFAAHYLPWLLLVFLAWQLLRSVERGLSTRPFVLMASSVIISALIALLIKSWHYRPRPFVIWSGDVTALLPHVPDAAFPSAHAAVFFALALAVWSYHRRWGVWFCSAALVIGLGRVAAGLHSPLDILGGAALGVLVSACLIRLFRYNPRHVRS